MTRQQDEKHEPNPSCTRRSFALFGAATVAAGGFALEDPAMAYGTADERYVRGMEVLKEIGGEGYDIPVNNLAKVAPDLARFTVEYPYGDILSRPGLDLSLRQVVTVSALMAGGSAQPQLKYHMHGFLNVGGSPRELVEVVFASIAILGFTSPINAIALIREIFKERKVSFEPLAPATDDGVNRYERGLAAIARLNRGDIVSTLRSIEKMSPELARWTVEFAYGDILGRDTLDPKVRQLAIISMLAATGNRTEALRFHIEGALNAGLQRTEIVEAFTQISVYSGFPAALNAFTLAQTVFKEADGRTPGPATAASAVTSEARQPRLDRGAATLAKSSAASGQAVISGFDDIAPDIGRLIVEHAYGDIFVRPSLDLKMRELAACSALAAIGSKTMETPLRVHVNAAVTAGATKTEIMETLLNLLPYVGYPVVEQGIRIASAEIDKRGL
ncbi:carboxymuconolactone decarboxylase family protein [Inquilinus sp. OTU3971]|uniref:carboxymuconolactone decarboxylase family protein n=1 Tax=Inquilinus sp. OTU3971 TaxID=3043855 RepID=UPI00313F1EE2